MSPRMNSCTDTAREHNARTRGLAHTKTPCKPVKLTNTLTRNHTTALHMHAEKIQNPSKTIEKPTPESAHTTPPPALACCNTSSVPPQLAWTEGSSAHVKRSLSAGLITVRSGD